MILSRKKIEEGQKLKYVNVKINGVNKKLQLDTCSDIYIINVLTWKQIVSLPLNKKKQLTEWLEVYQKRN